MTKKEEGVKGIKAWEALKALQEGKQLQIYTGDGVIHSWQNYTTGSYADDLANIPHMIINHLVPFRIEDKRIDIEFISDFTIDDKINVKHKITYQADFIGNPISETIKIKKETL